MTETEEDKSRFMIVVQWSSLNVVLGLKHEVEMVHTEAVDLVSFGFLWTKDALRSLA